ncbi:hypothetical protein BC829DRAFT_381090 [Chytridium lagenaria]|nr:hypothetical protein BC829DRAFT_381090 [Chytridium lagenaria]
MTEEEGDGSHEPAHCWRERGLFGGWKLQASFPFILHTPLKLTSQYPRALIKLFFTLCLFVVIATLIVHFTVIRSHGVLTGIWSNTLKNSIRPFPSIPKHIWTYWESKDGSIPPIITAMINGWRWYNPHYNITVITSKTISDYIRIPLPVNFYADHMQSHRSNWIRLAVLLEHGGFFLEPTTLVTQSLEPFHRRQQAQHSETFAFYLDYYTLNKNLPNYAHLAIAGQKVLTTEKIPIPAGDETEKGPYKILKECKYDDWAYARRLMYPVMTETLLPPVIMLRSHTIKALEKVLVKERTVPPPKTSIYGRYVMRFMNSTVR